MRFTYRLREDASGWLAECVESDAMGAGKTQTDAIESLRASLEERMFRPDAVAPPLEETRAPIELVQTAEPAQQASVEPSGPGG